ncbi:MAG: hypothetical protein QNI98_12765 [Woeseiaceae bacterium]|nr:hypothetical protein [Woeseiaceae bacterium]
MKYRYTAGMLLSATMLAACVSSPPAEPQAIQLNYQGERSTALADDAPCIWIRDARRNQDFYGKRIESDEALQWLEQGIAAQLKAHTRLTDSRLPERGLLISLQRAYVNPIDVTLSGVVVVEVVWGERRSVYRGQEVQTNWWGAEGEFGRTMSAALDNALQKINFPVDTSTCDPQYEHSADAQIGD